MALPQFQDGTNSFQLMQNAWASALNPLLANALAQGQLLKSVSLASGPNNINHKLGRKLQGWIIVRLRASATVYDTQDANQSPAVTLQLTASAPAVVDLWVF